LIWIILSLTAAAATLVYWGVVAAELLRAMWTLPTPRDGLKMAEAALSRQQWPELLVVIPAHNEARTISQVARSLMAEDYPKLRVVFALDRCSDNTESVLRSVVGDDERFEVVIVSHCPADWAGKVHAIYAGLHGSAAAQRANVLVFADADTWFERGCLRGCLALLERRRLGLLSLASTLTSHNWYERAVQPVAGFQMLAMYPPYRANRTERRRPLANGQFMMFTRDAYVRVGGHPMMRFHLLEDLAFSRTVAEAGLNPGFFMADGMLGCKMYHSWGEFRRGWKRIFTELAGRRAGKLQSLAVRLMVFSSLLPAASTAGLIAGATLGPWWVAVPCGVAIATCLSSLLLGHRWGRTPLWTVVLHVPGAVLVGALMIQAAGDLRAGRGINWGGRRYQRTAGLPTQASAEQGPGQSGRFPPLPEPAAAHTPVSGIQTPPAHAR
jgi:chlorobactene glucosyltransferase